MRYRQEWHQDGEHLADYYAHCRYKMKRCLSLSYFHQKMFYKDCSGARAPLVDTRSGKLYVCNQSVCRNNFRNNRKGKKELRTVRVLREPKSIVLDPEGDYLFVLIFFRHNACGCRYGGSLCFCY